MNAPAGPPVAASITIHRQVVGAHSSRPDDRAANGLGLARRATRLVGGGLRRELLVFGAIGVVSTAAYAILYLALRSVAGPTTANGLALVITAVGNTTANRRLTFGVRGRASMVRDQVAGLAALGVALGITTAAVGLLGVLAPGAGRMVELAVLVVANALATASRYVLLRTWIARDHRGAASPAPVEAAEPAAVLHHVGQP